MTIQEMVDDILTNNVLKSKYEFEVTYIDDEDVVKAIIDCISNNGDQSIRIDVITDDGEYRYYVTNYEDCDDWVDTAEDVITFIESM
jgi:hypothetical protein